MLTTLAKVITTSTTGATHDRQAKSKPPTDAIFSVSLHRTKLDRRLIYNEMADKCGE